MKHFVETRGPSFPKVPANQPLGPFTQTRWQVMCGDEGHWRVGLYSPGESDISQVRELERHDCPEFFWLISGRMILVLSNETGETRQVPLEPGRPILVTLPHSGYCPDGPYTGQALVIEQDEFNTEYRGVADWGDD